MTEFGSLTPEPEVDPAIINRNYAESSANVRARFKLYQYIEIDGTTPPDISEYAVDALCDRSILPAAGIVGDVGGSDGSLAKYLLIDKGYDGEVTVIDPNTRQFAKSENSEMSEDDWYAVRWADRRPELDFDVIDNLMKTKNVAAWQPSGRLRYRYGLAQDLSLYGDQSVDALFAMFMMYHVPTKERPAAFAEFDRVMKPAAVLTVATSGAENKREHRRLEHLLAYKLGVEPPPAMNSGFTSEKAVDEIAAYFPHLYSYEQKGPIVINNVGRAGDYIRSLGSLHDQCQPTPNLRDYYDAITSEIVPLLQEDISSRGAFLDFAHRSVFFASHVELDLESIPGVEKLS